MHRSAVDDTDVAVAETDSTPHAIPADLRERVLYTTLLPFVRMAGVLGSSLRDLTDLLEMAYFHEARTRGMRLREIASLFGVSMRKAAQLSHRLKHNFLSADEQVGLPRRIEFLLWGEPLSRARIARALPDVPQEAVHAALARLVAEERVRRRRRGRVEVYERTRKNSRLVEAKWENRLDGLGHLLANVASAIYGRCFREEEKALIRTISFYLRAEDLGALQRIYERVWEDVQRLEAAAESDPQALRMELSLVFSPIDYLLNRSTR